MTRTSGLGPLGSIKLSVKGGVQGLEQLLGRARRHADKASGVLKRPGLLNFLREGGRETAHETGRPGRPRLGTWELATLASL